MTDPRAPKAPWLMPYLTVRDARRTIDFYLRAFGFDCTNLSEHDGNPQHVEFSYRNVSLVMFAPEGAFNGTAKVPATLGIECPFTLYVYVDDVDAMFARAVAAGAKPIMAPEDQYWGDRFCLVEDIDGYRWGFARCLAAK